MSTEIPRTPEDPDGELDEIKVALKTIVEDLEAPDRMAHREMRSVYRKHELFWHGVQKIIQTGVSREWVTPQGYLKLNPNSKIPDSAMGDRSINVYRAHGESIIAALTTGMPTVKFFPDDADNSDDLNTAKAASRISELIQEKNQAQLKFIYALFLMYNQGIVFAYNYHDSNKRYGTTEKEIEVGTHMETMESPPTCPVCQYPFEETDLDPMTGSYNCTSCGEIIPEDQAIKTPYEAEMPTMETIEEPKSMEVVELFGPLNVKIAPYARTLSDTPYLVLELEVHYSYVREIYPEIFEDITGAHGDSTAYDRTFRTNHENKELHTMRKVWVHSWAFNVYETDEELRNKFKEQFPNGACITFIDELFADVNDEAMEDFWTITESPLCSVAYADPLGSTIMPIQEIRTEIVDLIVETLEKGIPQTFADPDVLDFDAYEEAEVAPGMVYPAKAKGIQSLDSAFAQLKTANLSDETRYFLSQLEQDAQFVGGAFPSVFGGVLKGGSNTASEYEMSRNQALQRLSTTWKVVNAWWAKVMEKAVKSYIKHVQEDEKMVKPSGDSFINVWIRKSELAGKIGGATAETSEQFPTSWVQQRGMLLEIMAMQNPYIDHALYDPENVSVVAQLIGIPGIKIPGEMDRDKQLAEIAELVKGVSIPPEPMIDPVTGMPVLDPMTGQPQMGPPTPSIPIDPEVDNHEQQAYVCRAWAVSSVGRATKIDNPEGYMNVIAHMIAHEQMIPPPPMVDAEGKPLEETTPQEKET